MKAFILLFCLLPFSAFASWPLEVGLGIDGETWKLDRAVFVEAKEQSLTLGRYILKMSVKKSTQENGLDVDYTLHEKKGGKLILVTKGTDIIENKGASDIYAKGEPGQPNTIFSLKFKK